MITLNNICKTYGNESQQHLVLKDICLTIDQNDYIAILGRSGSGKSTLLNIIGLLDIASAGEYLINDITVTQQKIHSLALLRRKYFGFVFQNYNLLENYRIDENISMPMYYLKRNFDYDREHFHYLIDRLQLNNLLDKYPRHLSGGEQQRVAVARALINNPKFIIADEPTGALDTTNATNLMQLFTELHHNGCGIILVTHDQAVAKYAKRKLYLDNGCLVTQ
ncbi:ABC transporter [Photorhabdus luminescens subsp. luminescens]|uniref:Putative ABC transport system ATP-binding protein n=1 Tax=Photorhabdus luminescens TaxID=29488 RepID=A0A1G5Q6K4_PHOLU|nr:ABC transporter ATP-binding protein [Photorhabdus luminescens]KMW74302.1 ABC transporter [Photorhabdus luminescens subsp. luminescens]SCZ57473.1 putative ABC transport system ATP-binding protein [Photorhabdus luminescens]